MRPDGHECRIECTFSHFGEEMLDLVIEDNSDSHVLDALDLPHQLGSRHAIRGNAEVHHSAGKRTRLVDVDLVPESGEMVSRRETAWPSAYDEHALAGRWRLNWQLPAFFSGPVAEKPLDGVDADGAVEFLAIAVILARVVADAAVDSGQRIVFHQRQPRLAVAALPRMGEPSLNVLAGRAGIVAGRQEVDIGRPLRAHRADSLHPG